MTARGEVWTLLLAHTGEWVTRGEIERVGGLESMRRLREIRGIALAQGYTFEQRRTKGVLEYRLMVIGAASGSWTWVCVKCGSNPAQPPQPTTDTRDRWRTGWCVLCGNKHAIFRTAR